MNYIKPKAALILIAILSIVAILVVIIIKSQGILYDEAYFIPNIFLIKELGLTKEFLLKITGSPGPTYAVIHSLFTGITNFSILGIRLVNAGLMLLLLLFIYLNAKLLNAGSAILTSANFIYVPIVWVVCGLALTEVPTMLCAMLSLFFTLKSLHGKQVLFVRVLMAVAAGLFLSFAILGRSFFLMVVFAALAGTMVHIIVTKFDSADKVKGSNLSLAINKRQFILLLPLFLCFALLLPLRVFILWGALAPPIETAVVGANNLSIVPWYGLLAYCYCGFVALILAPKWFVLDKRAIIVTSIISLIFLAINISRGYLEFAPFLSAATKFLSPGTFSIYQRFVPALVFFVSFQFLLSSAIRLWNHRHNPVFLFIGFAALFIALSAIKVKAQFSSRYVAQIVPYFLLLFIPYDRNDWPKVIRVSIGAALGFVSLYFYYQS
jgi:hypothetical protein